MLQLLIVDDEADFGDFVAEAARELGHDAETASSDAEFSAKYTRKTDIIFLDLFMPGMDGIEVIRFLSDNKSRAAVVLMSGHNATILNSARELAEEHGIEVLAVLEKPIGIDEIAGAIANFGQRKPAGSARRIVTSIDEIREALDREAFFLVYQPQIALNGGQLIGIEALLRWRHPEHGVLSPSVFMPIIETSELIGPVTEFVIRRVCRDMPELHRVNGTMHVAINLSANSIFDIDFPDRLDRYVRMHGIEPRQIVLEITETAVMSDLAVSLDILTRLRMRGFELSIDDFGIGYSSMEQLVRIPFSELKIDQKFVRNLVKNAEYRAVVEISTTLGHNLGMTVIAEGVEDEETLDAIRAIGCDEGQGYWIGRPMPIEDLRTWLANNSSAASTG
ncbi:MAG: EAL domain-containing response regulator [Nisaea sp.]|uniref:EAL domain-containing response regulator n=1 Tax=Nisaea sp. TaxID=2024842 RepID=UPI001B03BEAF|nr:EAL domain-containing response regulator [Nisaea sp.]MBO6559459.1 EAL domain-containing response regulator [Nisaea sp.]